MKQKNFEVNDLRKRFTKNETAMIAKIESALIMGGVDFCESTGYQFLIVPHLTKATGACENFSTLFSTDLFGQTAYLNQTGQLMLEAFIDKFKKTYCFGPSFRKEPKADERHLIEFPLFEIEVANYSLQMLQVEISDLIKAMLYYVEKKCEYELEQLVGDSSLEQLKPPYASITYQEAISFFPNLKFGDDLTSENEQELVKINNNRPLFVTHYPAQIKFFNMRLNREDSSIVNSMDLIMPYSGEAVGAAEREEDYFILKKRLESSEMLNLLKKAILNENGNRNLTQQELHSIAMSRFEWYLNIVKEKPIQHSGCGVGINRLAQAILRNFDIRYSTALPLNRETLF